MTTFTLFTIHPNSEFGVPDKEITVKAENHIQHIYNETKLEGVSKAGVARIAAKFSADDVVYTVVGGRQVKVTGWTPLEASIVTTYKIGNKEFQTLREMAEYQATLDVLEIIDANCYVVENGIQRSLTEEEVETAGSYFLNADAK